MERRRVGREKRRVTCEIQAGPRRHHGIVRDVSAYGLFVQTDAALALGDSVHLTLRAPDGDSVQVDARVARKRIVPRRLASVASGGLGLRIERVPEEYFRLLAAGREGEPASAPQEPVPAAAAPEAVFRVRVKQNSGPRSRNLLVSAASEEAACEQALSDLEGDWQVLDVVPA